MRQSLNLIFFGSGPVAAKTLVSLKLAGFNFEYIVTKPRAKFFTGSVPVVELASSWNTKTLTPQSKVELSEVFKSMAFHSRLGLVVDYGLIIDKEVINRFPLGIVNSHFSLLPEWRGADPITYSILSGQVRTGVSLMLINDKLDEGLLIDQKTYDIPFDSNIITLTNDLVDLSNKMLITDLPKYTLGQIQPYPQSTSRATFSRKLKKEDGLIDWSKPAKVLEREVRAYLGWPKSYGNILSKDIIVTKSRVVNDQKEGALVMECGQDTWLEIQELIAPSGRKMSGEAFLRGYSKS